MKRLFWNSMTTSFWASPGSEIYDLILRANSWGSDRKALAMVPSLPLDDPLENPPSRPVRPIPTDVPVPDSHDVPVREPMDVPPPEPNIVPTPTKQPKGPRPDPNPRPTP